MGKKFIGDKFVLCTFPLTFRGHPLVLESGNDLGYVCSKIPEHADQGEAICVCEVVGSKWKVSDGDTTDSYPIKVVTLFQTYKYAEPTDDDEEENGDTFVNLPSVDV